MSQFGSVHGRFGSVWVRSWSGWVGSWSVWVSLGQFESVHGFMVSWGRIIIDLRSVCVRFMVDLWVSFGSVHGRVGSVHGQFVLV